MSDQAQPQDTRRSDCPCITATWCALYRYCLAESTPDECAVASALEAAQHRIAELEAELEADKLRLAAMVDSTDKCAGRVSELSSKLRRVHELQALTQDNQVRALERAESAETTLSAAARLIAQWREKEAYLRGEQSAAEDDRVKTQLGHRIDIYHRCANDLARVLGEQ